MQKASYTLRLVFLVIFLVFTTSCTTGEKKLAPGERPPNFELLDVNGKAVSLKSFSGKTILLNFWASWCLPCVEEAAELQLLQEKLLSKNFTVLGIAVDDELEDVKDFMKEHNVSFPILLDSEGKVRDLYSVQAYPETLLIDSKGILKFIIDDSTGNPELKILGPRVWSKSFFIEQFLQR